MKTSLVKTLSLALSIAGFMCTADSVLAAEIQGVTIASYSSQFMGTPVVDSVTNLVSDAGLFGDAHIAAPGGSMWYSGAGAPGTNFVTFNLGGVYTLNAIKVWNYNDSSSAANANIGVSNAAISYSSDGINFTTNIPSQNFVRGNGLVNTFGLPYAQTVTMPAPVTAQYVRINVRMNWAGNQTSGAGLAKVRFISNTNPPSVLSASENFGSNQVTVVFSESVDPASATTSGNYSVSGATISSVSMGEYPDRVILHTSLLTGSPSVTVSGVYDEALTAPVANGSTVPVKSEVFLWLKADQGVTTTPMFGGNMVTDWADQSPYGHNAQPANLFNVYTNQPFLVSSAINGQPALAFYGTNVMQIPNDPANPINGDLTVFMVFEKATTATAGYPISKLGGFGGGNNSNNYAAPFDIRFDSTGDGRPAFSIGNNAVGGNVITSPGTITANAPSIAAFSVTATNTGSIVVNGSQYAVGAFVTAPRDGGNPIYLGVRGDGLTGSLGNTFSGYIAEIILIRGTITPSDFANINTYLAAKYGIPLVPPGIAESPASVTVQAGQQATFWVDATNLFLTSTPGYVPANYTPNYGGLFPLPFTYQWQSNGVAILGATNAVYTTPNVTSSVNTPGYTVTVTSTLGSGSVDSTPAALTVVPDTTPPTVFSATKTASVNNVLVVFSEAVDSGTGLNAANYSLNDGASVISAAAGASPNQVILTTSTLDANAAYVLTVSNVQDLSGNAMAAASVSVMPMGMTMWLRGDSGIVTNGSSVIDAWLDQTANGNNAVTYAVPSAHRPSFGTDPVNLQPAVTFTEANKDYMIVNNSPSIALTGDMTIYVMLNMTDFSSYRELLAKSFGGASPAPYELNLNTGNGRIRYGRGAGSSPVSGVGVGSTGPSANVPGLVTAIGGPGLALHTYVNGYTPSYSGNFSVPFADNGTPLYIGTRNSFDTALFLGGDIQEIMVFSNAITAGDRTNVDNYFGAKYFSFTSTGPTNLSVNAGATATFSVTATQGSAHFAYQWLETPATNTLITNAIPGATGSSYTTPPTRVSDNGDIFSVLIYVPGTTTTNVSATATLTVSSVPPVVQSYGTAFWGTNIIVVNVQTPLDPTIATNPANYSLNNGATVLSATLVSPTEVILTTSPLINPPYTLNIQNLEDNNGATMSPTNFANVTATVYPPNMALWLRADEGVVASGGDISEWDDQSGNGNTFVSPGGTGDPTLVTNANGMPAVLFNGTNETYMYANPTPSLALTGDLTIFAVMNFTTYLNPSGGTGSGGGGEIISKNDSSAGTTPAPFDYYVYYGGGFTPLLLRGNGTTGQTPFAGGANSPATGEWHELSAMSQGDQELHRLDGRANGGAITWSVSGGVADDPNDYVFIGTREDTNIRLTGEMAELMVFGSALTTSDVTSIETYFGTKYGLITAPSIGILSSNSTAVVYWQNPQWSFVLQSTPSLNPPVSWSNVTNAITTINNTNVVTIQSGTNSVFYRLASQSQ